MSLEAQFQEAMLNVYRQAKSETGYTARIFLEMVVSRGGVSTAKALINAGHPSPGYTNLFERGRLDLTVEAKVVESPQWHVLFTNVELSKARERLRKFGYLPRADG
jgi:hypothetical protein